MLRQIKVGDRCPDTLPSGEGLVLSMSASGLQGIIKLADISREELKALKGPLELGVALVEECWPFVIVRFGKALELDSLLVLPPGEQREAMRRKWNSFVLYVVEAPHNIVRSIRLLGLDPELVKLLQQATLQPEDTVELQRKLRDLYSRYSTEQLWGMAQRQHFA